VYDLTHQLMPGIPRFPGDPEVRIAPLDGYAPWQVSALAMGTHSGTHMDAPRHRIAAGHGIGAYGPDRLVGKGLIVDARGFAANEPIPTRVIDGLRSDIWPGWFALICTGWDRYWGDERYFRHPFLSAHLATALVELEAGLVAIDTLSVDSTVDGGDAAHLILLGADTLIAENLTNLERLASGTPHFFAFLPLALGDADGAPARIVAWDGAEIST
jgi:arylformamidase